MPWSEQQCGACKGKKYRPCEHSKTKPHEITLAQDETCGNEVGRICDPPMCGDCNGNGFIYR